MPDVVYRQTQEVWYCNGGFDNATVDGGVASVDYGNVSGLLIKTDWYIKMGYNKGFVQCHRISTI